MTFDLELINYFLKNKHRYEAETEISVQRHIENRARVVGEMAMAKSRIYLDTKFWGEIRKDNNGGKYSQLGGLLKVAVEAGIAVCPISKPTIHELWKQTDYRSRMKTANLMDCLSQNICLLPLSMNITSEIATLVVNLALTEEGIDQVPTVGIEHRIWTNPSNAFGLIDTRLSPGRDDARAVLAKSYHDFMSDRSVSDLVQNPIDMSPITSLLKTQATIYNRLMQRMNGRFRSHQQAYTYHIEGIAENETEAAAILYQDTLSRMGIKRKLSADDAFRIKRQLYDDIINGLKKRKLVFTLRSMHILASLHALAFRNGTKLYDDHELIDFEHASSAAGYCDAVFTENNLATLLKKGTPCLSEVYDCFVTSDVNQAIAYVEGLLDQKLFPFANAKKIVDD